MTQKCIICGEFLFEWKLPHRCDPVFYVWESEGGATFTDAYDSGSRVFAKDAESAATSYFRDDFERSEIEVYVLSDKDSSPIIDELAECDQTEDEINRLNLSANELAECYTVTAEVVREVSAKLKPRSSKMTLSEFVENHCVGKQYDSCVESPCPFASSAGCRHPKHPKNIGDA